ncbi:MAG: hypothetical protein ABSG88_16595 [Bradyrhizobium sp.]
MKDDPPPHLKVVSFLQEIEADPACQRAIAKINMPHELADYIQAGCESVRNDPVMSAQYEFLMREIGDRKQPIVARLVKLMELIMRIASKNRN